MKGTLFMISVMALAVWAEDPPDVLYVNGTVYPVDKDFSQVEAFAVRGGRIVGIGTNAQMRSLAGSNTKVTDLQRRCVTPGLIDAHAHVSGLGSYAAGRLDLSDARNFDDVVNAVKAQAARVKPGEWILGGRWDQSLWGQKEFPVHHKLSEAVPHHPVWLDRVDGHAGLANAHAMRVAGITPSTPDPRGGDILRDREGNVTGIFVDAATDLIEKHIEGGRLTASDLILKAQEQCLSVGLTGVHDAGIGPSEIEGYQTLVRKGQLKIRIYGMLRWKAQDLAKIRPIREDRFTLRAVKLFMDGAMGSRGAWLLEPYADRPTDDEGKPYAGLSVLSPDELQRVARSALKNDWQVCTHAIGDRAIRETLNAYETALKEKPIQDHRFRIEHVQCVALSDIPRFLKLGVIPSMQQTHATSDMRWAEARVGLERIRGAYAWRKFANTGSRIAGGSDFPVEHHNPLLGIYAGVTRQDVQGTPVGGWYPEERQTREEALRSFTVDAAFAAFEDSIKGSLEPGKLADFVVWSKDIVLCSPRELLAAHPLRVVIGGETVWNASGE